MSEIIVKQSESGFRTTTEQKITPQKGTLKGSGRFFGQSEEGKQEPLMTVQQLNLSTTGQSIILPYHKHVLFDNVGVNLVQFSLDNSSYVDFLEVGKAYVMDEHSYSRQFYVKVSAGVGILRIITW